MLDEAEEGGNYRFVSEPRRVSILRALSVPAVIGAATFISFSLSDYVDLADIAMLYLVAIVLVASLLGRGHAIAASVLAVAAFDLVFVPPVFTFHVAETRHLITFAVMLISGVVIAAGAERIRHRSAEAHAERLRADREELRSSLLSSLSHDLRTPLAVITGAATSLSDESVHYAQRERQELLSTITEEAARLERLVTNVLQMSRLESEAGPVDKEWVPIEELVGAALNRQEGALEGRPVRTALPEVPWSVHVDPVLFGQVLINLLDNAGKHTPPGTPIDIVARGRDGRVTIEIADRGAGISPGSEQLVFEKFQRSTTSASGTGLGLAICRAIVHVHGGTIEARAREGGGAVFTVQLAAREAAPIQDAPPSEAT